MSNRVLLSLFSATALAGGCGAVSAPLDVVASVNVERYMGKWYEIARYPNFFESGCLGATAEYALQDNGTVSVVNTCRSNTLDGPEQRIQGTARVVDPTTNAKLKVSFFPPFEADYWIIELGADYEYAVVGEPSRSFLWILSRTPTLDDATYQQILNSLPAKGYDPAKLELTPQ